MNLIGNDPAYIRHVSGEGATMALTFKAPLAAVLTDDGRVDAKIFSKLVDISIPKLATAFGRSERLVRQSPAAKSLQPRARLMVDRINSLATVFGGIKYAVAWLNLPTGELGGESTMDLLMSGDERRFNVALGHIDNYLMMVPD